MFIGGQTKKHKLAKIFYYEVLLTFDFPLHPGTYKEPDDKGAEKRTSHRDEDGTPQRKFVKAQH